MLTAFDHDKVSSFFPGGGRELQVLPSKGSLMLITTGICMLL